MFILFVQTSITIPLGLNSDEKLNRALQQIVGNPSSKSIDGAGSNPNIRSLIITQTANQGSAGGADVTTALQQGTGDEDVTHIEVCLFGKSSADFIA